MQGLVRLVSFVLLRKQALERGLWRAAHLALGVLVHKCTDILVHCRRSQ